MRKPERDLEVILKDIEKMEERLLDAKANYADVVIEYLDIGHDVSKHHVPEAYRKEVIRLVEELNELYDEHHEAQYPESW